MRRLALTLALGTLAAVVVSCDSQEDTSQGTADSTAIIADSGSSADERLIAEMINEAMIRLRYKDKSVLYDNEFEYLRDDVTYDEYLKMDQIRWAQADSITYVEVRNVDFFDADSALVDVTVNFEGPTGHKSYHRDRITVYHHQGRWIKPTVSVIDMQLDYEHKIHVADSAAAAEAGEDF